MNYDQLLLFIISYMNVFTSRCYEEDNTNGIYIYCVY